jgi:transposase-like protein
MPKSVLCDKHFHDEAAAFEWVEKRVWPNGPVCPHCGGFDRISKMQGKSTRLGTYKCYQCRKPFTVKVGTIFESSHVAMHLWLQAIFLMSSSKKGVSSNQLHRTLGVTLKTAWFMSHRIREAMRDGVLAPMGGNGGIVEADETYYGKTKEPKISPQRKGRPYKVGSRGPRDKRAVLSLVERGGKVRSFHIENADKSTVAQIVSENVAKESRLHTDESRLYTGADQHFAAHETVRHSVKEYVRDDVHTNSAEGYFSIFKRGMRGIYQHCSEKHLHRYLAEYDFRYNHRIALGHDDTMRAEQAIKGAVGKRLTYETTCQG